MEQQRKELKQREQQQKKSREMAQEVINSSSNNNKDDSENDHKKHLTVKLNRNSASGSGGHRKQLSSLILFLSVIIFVNLCPFQSDFEYGEQPKLAGNGKEHNGSNLLLTTTTRHRNQYHNYHHNHFKHRVANGILANLESCLSFIKLMFTNPIRLSARDSKRFMQAQAKVLGKVAKMWYIKKKIKKLSKKLKKHTITVPVFTAIPIYEHSYYPPPYVTHVTHGGGGMHHAAAASSYTPTVTSPLVTSQSQQQQMVASASSNHQMAATYARVAAAPPPSHHHHHQAGPIGYHPISAHQIINAYAPSPPLFVDEAGGLYGQYGNSYGRYDGGYHLW